MIRLYMSDKNYEKAEVVYRRLKSINPTDIENYMQYAITLRINKLMRKAK